MLSFLTPYLFCSLVFLLTNCFSQTQNPPSPATSVASSNQTGLTSNTSSSQTSSSSSLLSNNASASMPSGPSSVKIFFNNQAQRGSFYQSSLQGSILPANTVFQTDLTPFQNFPNWLRSVTLQTNGQNATCFGFSTANESSLLPQGQLRSSETSCTSSLFGIQVTFDRSQLGSSENILAILEYFSAASQASPQNPQNCFSQGQFIPENCSEFTWKTYLSNASNSLSQFFSIVVPPFQLSQAFSPSQDPLISGATLQSQQLILPLASDPSLTVFHLLHQKGILTPQCQSSTNPSFFCSGIVFYSLTFYRI